MNKNKQAASNNDNNKQQQPQPQLKQRLNVGTFPHDMHVIPFARKGSTRTHPSMLTTFTEAKG
jgi:hypothetical protein